MENSLPDYVLGDLLANMDAAMLYMLERRHLDSWQPGYRDFILRNSRLNWKDSFQGIRLDGLRYYTDPSPGLALQNMENLLGHFRDGTHNLLGILDGRGGKIPEISFVTCSRKEELPAGFTPGAYAGLMERSMKANFPGALLSPVTTQTYTRLAAELGEYNHLGMLTGIPSRKNVHEDFFAQGMERLLDSVSGLDFSMLIVAEPYTTKETIGMIDPVLNLKNEVGQFLKYSTNEQFTKSLAKGNTFTAGGMGGQSSSQTVAKTFLGLGGKMQSGSAVVGALMPVVTAAVSGLGAGGLAAAGAAVVAAGPAIAAATAVGLAVGTGAAILSGRPLTRSLSNTTGRNFGGFASASRTTTKSFAETRGLTREAINYSAEYTLELLDKHIDRLRYARSYGYWNVGVYIFAKTPYDYTAVKNAAISVFSGENTAFEPLRIVDIGGAEGLAAGLHTQFVDEIVAGYNPKVKIYDEIRKEIDKGLDNDPMSYSAPLGECLEGLSSPMSTGELAILLSPPQRECRALSVTQRGTFGGKTLQSSRSLPDPMNELDLGEILYYGATTGETISLPKQDFTRHVFVTGLTGSGKTNTVQGWCRDLSRKKIPWMVIEPGGKSEYRHLLGELEGEVDVYSLGTEGTSLTESSRGIGAPFRFNPFYFPEGINLLTHIDGIKAAFSAAFPMYASMPYLLEEAITGIYTDCGWNLTTSTNGHSQEPWLLENQPFLFPTLRDLRDKINEVVLSKGYDQRLQMDLSAALRTRVGSLLLGGKGAMLNTPVSIDFCTLRERNVVIEMAALGNDDDKCLMMAFLLLAIHEQSVLSGLSSELKHVLIVEEAHRLFRNAGAADNPEVANIRGAAVEQFANQLAEMRAMGQGVVVVDQIPAKMIPDVIKNTALKCVHQLGALDDRKAVGETMALGEQEQLELARLKPSNGEMVAYHSSWEKSYMLKVKWHGQPKVTAEAMAKMREKLIKQLPAAYAACSEKGLQASTSNQESVRGLTKGILALAFTEPLLLQNIGIQKSIHDPALDILQKGKPRQTTEIQTVSHPVRAAMDEYLKDLMRVTPAKLALLQECRESFLTLAATNLNPEILQQKLTEIRKQWLHALELNSDETLLQKVALRSYIRSRKIERLALEISERSEKMGDGLTPLQREIRRHVEDLVGDAPIKVQKATERLMVEQLIVLAGMRQVDQIVETYAGRFL